MRCLSAVVRRPRTLFPVLAFAMVLGLVAGTDAKTQPEADATTALRRPDVAARSFGVERLQFMDPVSLLYAEDPLLRRRQARPPRVGLPA